MTPEQRKRLENNWLPLCAMDPKDCEALKRSDGPWLFLSFSGRWSDTFIPVWNGGGVFRLAPKPKRKPVVQWQFIHEDVVAVAMDRLGHFRSFSSPPQIDGVCSTWDGENKGHLSLELVGPGLLIDPGDLTRYDWKESLMIRPGYGESE